MKEWYFYLYALGLLSDLNVQVTVPSMASVFNEYALKSQYDTSIYLQVIQMEYPLHVFFFSHYCMMVLMEISLTFVSILSRLYATLTFILQLRNLRGAFLNILLLPFLAVMSL